MRILRKLRYYCDFCKKSGGQRRAMEVHETHCTSNPARECRMCDAAELVTQSIPDLFAAFAISFTELVALAENCPACILAALVQDRKRGADAIQSQMSEESYAQMFAWQYKPACDEFWKPINEMRREEDAALYGYVS